MVHRQYNPKVCFARRFAPEVEGAGVTPPLKSKPIRTVLAWQALATLAIAAGAGVWAGGHAALSAALGGLVTLSSTVVYAFVLGIGQTASAGATVVTMLRAEGAKILVIIVQLWLVLATYRDVVPAALFAAFVVTVLLFSTAFLSRE
ncbi:ATP synthase protein I [Burkholderiales bacterium]|nr:ATP synthase protein I [Burkholderiales bacterium]